MTTVDSIIADMGIKTRTQTNFKEGVWFYRWNDEKAALGEFDDATGDICYVVIKGNKNPEKLVNDAVALWNEKTAENGKTKIGTSH